MKKFIVLVLFLFITSFSFCEETITFKNPITVQAKKELLIWESEWFSVSANTSYVKNHNLGSQPHLVQVFISVNSDGSNARMLEPPNFYSGNSTWRGGWWHSLTNTSITLQFETHFLFVRDDIASGYAKIICVKFLE